MKAERHRQIQVIWLLRGLKPDFKITADFRDVYDADLAGSAAALLAVIEGLVMLDAGGRPQIADPSLIVLTKARQFRLGAA